MIGSYRPFLNLVETIWSVYSRRSGKPYQKNRAKILIHRLRLPKRNIDYVYCSHQFLSWNMADHEFKSNILVSYSNMYQEL